MLRNTTIMTEPVCTSAGGYALLKFLPPVVGPVLAAIIVMSIATPQSRREWVAALTSTVAVSIFGGSFLVSYFGWVAWVDHPFGIAAVTGMCFASGLPAWVLVRALFAYMGKQKGKDIAELAKAIAKDVGDVRNSL